MIFFSFRTACTIFA